LTVDVLMGMMVDACSTAGARGAKTGPRASTNRITQNHTFET
jgi:hypothetical protein